ncbi:hypothetical protein G6F37_000105 [Rhizopus arrhizus]|nr:hypothetical protein G6F38_002166 [Rhizopus arrhizus]KAG1164639.1 hypothetical protein G6F37_000105 [Rhizopus arrhizus]
MLPSSISSQIVDERRLSLMQRRSFVAEHTNSLSVSDMVHILRLLGLNVSEEFFNNPQRVRTQSLYITILSILCGWRMDRFKKKYQELTNNYEQSVLLFRKVDQLLKEIGYPRFKYVDVIAPSKNRLINIFNVIIRHILLRQEIWEMWEGRVKQVWITIQQVANLLQDKKLIKHQLDEDLTLYEQQKDEIQEIKAKNTMLEKELQGLEKETKTLAVQHEEIKSQQIPLVEQLHSFKETIGIRREILADYRAKASYNHEQTKESIETFKQQHQQSIVLVKQLEAAIQKIDTIYPQLREMSRQLSVASKFIANIQGDKSESRKANMTSQALIDEIQKNEKILTAAVDAFNDSKTALRKNEAHIDKVKRKEQITKMRDSAHREEIKNKRAKSELSLREIRQLLTTKLENIRNLKEELKDMDHEERLDRENWHAGLSKVFLYLEIVEDKVQE